MPSPPTSLAAHARRRRVRVVPIVLHLAVSRAAAARLAPVADALDGPQLCVDPTGRVRAWSGAPDVGEPVASPGELARSVAAALARVRPDAVLVAGDDDAAVAVAFAAARAGV